MNRMEAYFGDVETAANFLSLYFGQSDYSGKSCAKCPCRAVCSANSVDMYCEDVIAEWLEGEA